LRCKISFSEESHRDLVYMVYREEMVVMMNTVVMMNMVVMVETVGISFKVAIGKYVQYSLPPGPRAWDQSQGAGGWSRRNGSSGPGPRVFDIAPFQGKGGSPNDYFMQFITLLDPNRNTL
jgi:hypothetical protein